MNFTGNKLGCSGKTFFNNVKNVHQIIVFQTIFFLFSLQTGENPPLQAEISAKNVFSPPYSRILNTKYAVPTFSDLKQKSYNFPPYRFVYKRRFFGGFPKADLRMK